MRVLMLARFLPQEGSTTHMYTLAKGLIERGHRVSIASAGHNGSAGAIRIYQESIADGVQHIWMPFPRRPHFGFWGRFLQAIVYFVAAPVSLFQIAKFKPDVIHVHYPVTSYLASIYRLLTGRKFVTTHHIAQIPRHPLNRKADIVVAISTQLRDELIHVHGYEPDCVSLIHNGVEDSRFESLKRAGRAEILKAVDLSGVDDRVIVGFVGSISQRKGLDVLLRAVVALDKSRFYLVIVGDGDHDWLRGLISAYQLEDNVSVSGFSQPEPFYAAFDILVLPSRREGFPLVPLEAMMSGVLVVRSDVEGAAEQIESGVTGILFESENAVELGQILEDLIRDPSAASAVAACGQESAIARFSVKSMLDKIEAQYGRLVRARSAQES